MTQLLQHWITEHSDRRPDARAVSLGSDSMTFGELEALSNRIGHVLLEAGCQRGDRVCLLMEKSPPALAAIYGVLKAGCIYVPLDPASPASRLHKIIRESEPRMLLVGDRTRAMVDTLASVRLDPTVGSLGVSDNDGGEHALAFGAREIAQASKNPCRSRGSSLDPAYILFTSGSTGTPKGVVIAHRSVLAFAEWVTRFFGVTPTDRLSGHPSFHFDLSVLDIYGAAASGAELCLVPSELSLLPGELAAFIREMALTQWCSVPSVLNYMVKFDVVRPDAFPQLRRVMWCGEVFPTPYLMHWMQRLPHVSFTNLYGPTEATCASSYYAIPACPDDEREAIPIGQPCDQEELLVLDDDLKPTPVGKVGNLFIGGVGLAQGYWRDPEKTEAAFLPDPRRGTQHARIYRTGDLARVGEDGLFYYVGRADSQIKSRGYRIELGEIEAALGALGSLRDGAIVAIPTGGFEGASICCAYVPANGTTVAPVDLRRALGDELPSYMMPAKWKQFDELPRTENGKLDRPKLRRIFEQEHS